MRTRLTQYPWRRHVMCVAPLIAVYLTVGLLIGNEEAVELFFTTIRDANPFFTEVVEEISDFGHAGFYLAYAALLALGIRRRKRSLVRFVCSYLAALVATLLVVEVAKFAIGRPRPLTDGAFDYFCSDRAWQSFPSGHVSESVVTVTPLAVRYGQRFLPLLFGFVPAVMGLTRLYLGEHHPSDFLGSILFGSIGVFLCWYFSRFSKS